jgi:hypothetical protein
MPLKLFYTAKLAKQESLTKLKLLTENGEENAQQNNRSAAPFKSD